MNCNADAFSNGSVVAFSCRDVLALRSIVELCIHVVFDFFEEGLEFNVQLDGSDINRSVRHEEFPSHWESGREGDEDELRSP